MAYIGAESPSDWLLHDIRKGTCADQTLEAMEQCRGHGVIPELSFMLAPPQDPEGETERTFEFIRMIKRLHPATEVMIYIYTPLPQRRDRRMRPPCAWRASCAIASGNPVVFPQTADEWARTAVARLLVSPGCAVAVGAVAAADRRFHHGAGMPIPDHHGHPRFGLGKSALRALASWRYRFQRYDDPWELRVSRKVIRHWDPRVMSL